MTIEITCDITHHWSAYLQCRIIRPHQYVYILDDETAAKTCHAQDTCGKCIAAGPKCGWCTQEVLFAC